MRHESGVAAKAFLTQGQRLNSSFRVGRVTPAPGAPSGSGRRSPPPRAPPAAAPDRAPDPRASHCARPPPPGPGSSRAPSVLPAPPGPAPPAAALPEALRRRPAIRALHQAAGCGTPSSVPFFPLSSAGPHALARFIHVGRTRSLPAAPSGGGGRPGAGRPEAG